MRQKTWASWIVFIAATLLLVTPVIGQEDDDYVIPPTPENVDLDQVIGGVDDNTFTLGDFANRVRFDRYRFFYAPLQSFVEQMGPDVLDLDSPDNQQAGAIEDFLRQTVDDLALGDNAYRTMILERLFHQEAMARGIETSECDVDRIWAQALELQAEFNDCEPPEGFEEQRQVYLDETSRLSGMTTEEIALVFESFAEIELVLDSVAEALEVEPLEAVSTRQIRVQDEATAQEVVARLEAGEDFDELLVEYTIDPGAVPTGGETGARPIDQFGQGFGQEFQNAVLAAAVGEVVGPVQSQFGYHIVEVLERIPSVTLRHILVSSEDEALAVLNLLENGASFGEMVRNFSIDTASVQQMQPGSLGTVLLNGNTGLVPEFEAAITDGQTGDLLGPIETEFGWHLVEITSRNEGASVNLRQIVVEELEEAENVLDRLENGEEFNALAAEVSIDPSAAGNRGDTLSILTGGQNTGLFIRGETFPQIEQAVFGTDVEVGDIVGPINLQNQGFLVLRVEEVGTRMPPDQALQAQENAFTQAWVEEQLDSERVLETDLWRTYIPTNLMPSDVSESLASVDPLIDAYREDYRAQLESTNVINTLRGLQLDDQNDE